MDLRIKAVLSDTAKLDRIRCRELEKKARIRQFASLKKSFLPLVEPDINIIKNHKCRNCRIVSEIFTNSYDWHKNCIDVAAKLNIKKENWTLWMKKFFSAQLISTPKLDPIVIHPAHVTMLKNIQQKYPTVPLVFVVKPIFPQSDLQLVQNILETHDIKVHLTMQQDDKKVSESQVSSILQSQGNILLILNELHNYDLKCVLKACDFGFAAKVFLLPITMNSECFIEGKRGITKVSFLEPYSIEDLLKQKEPPTDTEKAVNTIVDHLNYDTVLNRPIMSTNAVAFIMMEFRIHATNYKTIYAELNLMRRKFTMIDFGFDGDTEAIADRGIELLSEFLEINEDFALDVKEIQVLLTNESSKVCQMWHYAKDLLPHYSLELIVIHCALKIKKEKGIIGFHSLIEQCMELSNTLNYTAHLIKPCEDHKMKVQQVFDSLAADGFLQKPMAPLVTESQQRAMRLAKQFAFENDSDDDSDRYQTEEDEVKILRDYLSPHEIFLIPMLDAYLTMACCLVKFRNEEDFSIESFIKLSIQMMSEEIEDLKKCKYWESTSTILMESCLKSFESWNIVMIKEEIMNIHPDYKHRRAVKDLTYNLDKLF